MCLFGHVLKSLPCVTLKQNTAYLLFIFLSVANLSKRNVKILFVAGLLLYFQRNTLISMWTKFVT